MRLRRQAVSKETVRRLARTRRQACQLVLGESAQRKTVVLIGGFRGRHLFPAPIRS
jgi:hypothetical protein